MAKHRKTYFLNLELFEQLNGIFMRATDQLGNYMLLPEQTIYFENGTAYMNIGNVTIECTEHVNLEFLGVPVKV